MKTFIILCLISTQGWGLSVVPDRVVTPPLDLYNHSNKVLPNGDMEVKVTAYNKWGVFRKNGSKTVLTKEQYDSYKKLADPVLEMIPRSTNNSDYEEKRGTAFSIGNNLVITNHHVLDPSFENKTSCGNFELKNHEGITFDCKTVHFCNSKHDICLIEMSPVTKTKRDCTMCSGTQYKVSLSDGPSLKLKLKYNPESSEQSQEMLTAIGNSGGFGIHLAQGLGVRIVPNNLYFYAPITGGNSGGPLLNDQGEVIGIVKMQSKKLIGTDPNKVYNIASTSAIAINLIRTALRDNPETLRKFNQAVIE